MRRVDGEESILGTELVEPKLVPLRKGGRVRVDVENVSIYSGGLSGRLARWSLKRVKAARRAGWGVVERVPKNNPPEASFSATFS